MGAISGRLIATRTAYALEIRFAKLLAIFALQLGRVFLFFTSRDETYKEESLNYVAGAAGVAAADWAASSRMRSFFS